MRQMTINQDGTVIGRKAGRLSGRKNGGKEKEGSCDLHRVFRGHLRFTGMFLSFGGTKLRSNHPLRAFPLVPCNSILVKNWYEWNT